MGTLGNPKTWIPYTNTKDCSQGFCSLPCPPQCYFVFPPPPPPSFPDPDDSSRSGPNLSPLVIAVIGILISAFLIVSYYAIISLYCGSASGAQRAGNHPPNYEETEDDNRNQDEPWVISNTGLDEALIKAIAIVKYKKGGGSVRTSDCSVCLGEFLEDERLRILPKCSHAFHVSCIDTWLKSQSNCPLCRDNLVASFDQPVHPTNVSLAMDDHPQARETSPQNREETQPSFEGEEASRSLRKSPFRAFSDLGDVQGHGGGAHTMRRSMSMDRSHELRISISDASGFGCEACQGERCRLCDQFSEERGAGERENSCSDGGGSSSSSGSGSGSDNGRGVLHCVMSSIAMKRSFSSSGFLFSKHGKLRRGVVPV